MKSRMKIKASLSENNSVLHADLLKFVKMTRKMLYKAHVSENDVLGMFKACCYTLIPSNNDVRNYVIVVTESYRKL